MLHESNTLSRLWFNAVEGEELMEEQDLPTTCTHDGQFFLVPMKGLKNCPHVHKPGINPSESSILRERKYLE